MGSVHVIALKDSCGSTSGGFFRDSGTALHAQMAWHGGGWEAQLPDKQLAKPPPRSGLHRVP